MFISEVTAAIVFIILIGSILLGVFVVRPLQTDRISFETSFRAKTNSFLV